jgi:hypothetical protein
MGFFGWLFTLFVPFSTLTFGLFQSLTLERHFFRRLFLAFLAYFAIGAWNNYNQFGATGWDALPHRDVWRDLPHVVVDIFKGRFPLSFSVLLHSNLRDFFYRRSRRESRWLLVYIISSSLAGMSTRFLRSSATSEKRVFLRRFILDPERLPLAVLRCDASLLRPRDLSAAGCYVRGLSVEVEEGKED